jgi:sec-independent protein translocase protein TatA
VPFGLQLWEVLLVLALALLIFGPQRLPEMGRSLGKGLREFKDSVTGKDDDDDRPHRERDDLGRELEAPRAETTVATDARDRDPVR